MFIGTFIGRRCIPLVSSSIYVQCDRCACDTHKITSYTDSSVEPGSSGSGANGLMSGGVATEHICGVVGVSGVVGVVTRMVVLSSLPPQSSRDRFGTRPYRTAVCMRKVSQFVSSLVKINDIA